MCNIEHSKILQLCGFNTHCYQDNVNISLGIRRGGEAIEDLVVILRKDQICKLHPKLSLSCTRNYHRFGAFKNIHFS